MFVAVLRVFHSFSCTLIWMLVFSFERFNICYFMVLKIFLFIYSQLITSSQLDKEFRKIFIPKTNVITLHKGKKNKKNKDDMYYNLIEVNGKIKLPIEVKLFLLFY